MILRPLAPAWLVVLAAVVLLAVVAWLVVRRPGERRWWLLRGLMVLLATAIVLRPGVGEQPAEARTSDLEVLVVVDRTLSMSALDWNGGEPRLAGVRSDLRELTEGLPGARFSLVTSGRVVRQELPFTSDTTAFLAAVDTVRREGLFAGAGSRADRPLGEMTTILEEAADARPDRRRLVVFVTDGENTVDSPQESFAPIEPLVDGGVVLGYGTEAGGRMPTDDEDTSSGYVYDQRSGADAVSKLDAANVATIAEQMGVDHLERTEPGGLDEWASDVGNRFVDDDEQAPARRDLTWTLALALFAVALVELRRDGTGLHAARREWAAL